MRRAFSLLLAGNLLSMAISTAAAIDAHAVNSHSVAAHPEGADVAATEEQHGSTELTGRLLNAADESPEAYAAVLFFAMGDQTEPIAYTVTAPDGTFRQSLPSEGSYTLLYSNIGKKELRISIVLKGENDYDLGTILVEDDIEALNAASIVEQKPLVKMDVDRITYKVADDVDAKTSTVLDMLRKVPMVSVDGQDNITVNGSSSFQVYVDGKPNQMLSANPSLIFKFMTASTVKDIEVITNPGARYDAEGAGGILNLSTNTEATGGASAIADGAFGSISANASNRGPGGGIFLNIQKGKFSTGITANTIDQNMGGTIINMDRVQYTPSGDMNTSYHIETDLKVAVRMLSFSADYEIDQRNSISAAAGYSGTTTDMEGVNRGTMSIPSMAGFGYDGTLAIRNPNRSFTASADYQHTWDDDYKKFFIFSYQFSSTPTINNTMNTFAGSLPAMNLIDRKTDGRTNSLNHSIQADFITPLGEGGTFSTGLKYLNRDNTSDQINYLWNGQSFEKTELGSLDYDFINRIAAAYAEYASQLGSFGLKAGLRYEHTWQDVSYAAGQGEDFSMRYVNLVPSASVQYNIGATGNIGLAYNMRVSRPGITYLNPYIDRTDPTQLSYGNTELRTENNHNISFIYNRYSGKLMLNTNLRLSYTPEGITQYSFLDAGGLLNNTYGNIVESRIAGLNAFLMYTPFKQTQLILNAELNYADLRSKELEQRNSGLSHTFLIGIQQTIFWDLRLSANMVTAGRTITLQGSSDGLSMLVLGLSRSFMDNKLGVSLSAIGSTSGVYIDALSTTEGPDFTATTHTKVPLGQIKANISWSFGTKRVQSARQSRKVEIEDSQLNSRSIGESIGTIIKSSN